MDKDKKQYVIKEAWLLDKNGVKIMKLELCSFESPLDNMEIVYEGSVAALKPKN